MGCADKHSEVACVIRALRPEFSHIEKHPFLHSPAIGMSGTAATVYHAPSQKVSPPPTQYPLSPPESNTAPEVRSRRVEGPPKFLFWYIGELDRVQKLGAA